MRRLKTWRMTGLSYPLSEQESFSPFIRGSTQQDGSMQAKFRRHQSSCRPHGHRIPPDSLMPAVSFPTLPPFLCVPDA